MEPQVARFTLELDDLVDVQNLMQRPLMLLATIIGTAALLAGLYLSLAADDPLFGLGLILYGFFDLTIAHFRPLRRLAAARRTARIVGSHVEFRLDPANGLEWVESGGHGAIAWSALSEVREGDRVLAFMTGAAVRAVVPKRAFASQDQMAAFLSEARRLITLGRS